MSAKVAPSRNESAGTRGDRGCHWPLACPTAGSCLPPAFNADDQDEQGSPPAPLLCERERVGVGNRAGRTRKRSQQSELLHRSDAVPLAAARCSLSALCPRCGRGNSQTRGGLLRLFDRKHKLSLCLCETLQLTAAGTTRPKSHSPEADESCRRRTSRPAGPPGHLFFCTLPAALRRAAFFLRALRPACLMIAVPARATASACYFCRAVEHRARSARPSLSCAWARSRASV